MNILLYIVTDDHVIFPYAHHVTLHEDCLDQGLYASIVMHASSACDIYSRYSYT